MPCTIPQEQKILYLQKRNNHNDSVIIPLALELWSMFLPRPTCLVASGPAPTQTPLARHAADANFGQE